MHDQHQLRLDNLESIGLHQKLKIQRLPLAIPLAKRPMFLCVADLFVELTSPYQHMKKIMVVPNRLLNSTENHK